jgi:hypothetical protein
MLDLDVLTSWKPQNQAQWADLLDHERQQLIGLRTEMTRLPEAPRATALPLVAARRYLHVGADIDTMITALGMIAQAKRVAAVRVGAAKDEALTAHAMIVSHGWSVVCEADTVRVVAASESIEASRAEVAAAARKLRNTLLSAHRANRDLNLVTSTARTLTLRQGLPAHRRVGRSTLSRRPQAVPSRYCW